VSGGAAIGIDDHLAPGKAGVAHRPADHELARRIDDHELVEAGGVVEVFGQDRLDHVLDQVGADHALYVGRVRMLGREDDLDDLYGAAVLVAHRDLRLTVRAQVGQHAGFAHVGESPGELVRERDRQRHELARLVAGEAEHHPLVAGAL